MAKYECTLRGDYDQALRYFHEGILNGSMSVSFEEESYFQSFGVRVTVRVYERYSMTGGNRLSMTLTLVGDGEKLYLSGITAGDQIITTWHPDLKDGAAVALAQQQ